MLKVSRGGRQLSVLERDLADEGINVLQQKKFERHGIATLLGGAPRGLGNYTLEMNR